MLWQIQRLMLSCVAGLCQFGKRPAAAAIHDVVVVTLHVCC